MEDIVVGQKGDLLLFLRLQVDSLVPKREVDLDSIGSASDEPDS
jgi:hypothetical protein